VPPNVEEHRGKTFTVTQPCGSIPEIDRLNPTSVPPGAQVRVIGGNFTQGSTVQVRRYDGGAIIPAFTTTFVSNTELRLNVPPDRACGFYWLGVKDAAVAQESNTLTLPVSCPPLANWDLRLNRLHVFEAQEYSGDDPYLVVIGFRSRLFQPGTTVVWWNGYLDDDWADDTRAGSSVDVPQRMGNVTFPRVELRDIREILGSDMLGLLAVKPEFVGAAVIVMESDRTPWGTVGDLVREALPMVRNAIDTIIANPDGTALITDPNAYVDEMIKHAKDEIEGIVESFWTKLWIGTTSGGDVDDLIGFHVFLFAAVNVVAGDPPVIPGDVQATTGVLQDRTLLFSVDGDGARYQINGAVTPRAIPPGPDLTVSIRHTSTSAEEITFTVKVKNEGANAAGPCVLQFQPGTLVPTTRAQVPQLAAGGLHEFKFVGLIASGGDYTSRAVVDVGNAVSESNENNNAAVHTFRVRTPPNPR